MSKPNSLSLLEKQLADAEKKSIQLRKKNETEKSKNKPKSIMDMVKTMKDVIAITKPSKEVLSIVNYTGEDELMLHSKYEMRCVLIAKALNEGWFPKMDGSENRYYGWFKFSSGSGFVFDGTTYDYTFASASSAARLCLKDRVIAEYASKQFLPEYKQFITK